MDSNATRLGYVEETVFGTTPSANLQILRRTGGNFRPSQTTITSQEIRTDYRGGTPVRTSQMAQGEINVEWSYGTLDDLLEGMLMSAWSSNVLVDGTTKKSYTFEEQFVDGAISPSQYMIYKGCRIASMSMSLALESMVTGSFSVMGATPSIAQASVGAGNTAATSTSPFNCVDMVSSLTEGSASGSATAISKITGIDIQIDRSIRPKRELGSLNPFDMGVGRLLVTGTVQQYFENDTLMDAYFAFGDRQINITLDDGTSQLLVQIPKLKYVGDADIGNPGPDGDRIVSIPFEAYATAADSALIRFTRTP